MDTLLHQPKIWLTDEEQMECKDQQCHLQKKCVCYQGSFFDQLHALLGCDTTSWLFGIEQGRIHGYPSRVRVGRSSDGEGHWGIWAGVGSKRSKTPKK